MKHVKHGKKLISLLLSVAVAMSMTLSTVMTPLAASSSVSDLRQKLQELMKAETAPAETESGASAETAAPGGGETDPALLYIDRAYRVLPHLEDEA